MAESAKIFEPKLPSWFEPLEMDTELRRHRDVGLNDFDKWHTIGQLATLSCGKVIAKGPPDNYREAIVEVGSWMGANAIALTQYTGLPIFCVDTWKGGHDTNGITAEVLGSRAVFQTFLRNCRDYLWSDIIPCVGQSTTYAKEWPFQVPLVFIDADHEYANVKADLEMWWPHVAPGGVLVGHDYESFSDVQRAADEFGFDERCGELFWRWKDD